MAALSRDEFFAAALNEVAAFPNLAQFASAQDPRVLAQLSAQAMMLSMVSTQVDVSMFEPFTKSRDGTVLADAALKGILPLARACRITLNIENAGSSTVTLGSQRRLLDFKGRLYEIDSTVSIPAGGTGTVSAQQIRRRTTNHTVIAASDFYQIQVPLAADGLNLNTLSVLLDNKEFSYAPDWCNVAVDQRSYQVEVDELRRMFIRFGKNTVIGYGVKVGDKFTLEMTECNGRIDGLAPGGEFNLEYILAAGEPDLKLTLVSVDDAGADPATMQELRVMARYPAIYDHNAVYLGEFDFLLRRYMAGIRFLSVWNEQVEEGVRGASVDNINTLFVSGLVTGMSDQEFEDRVTQLVRRADSSYRISIVPTVLTPVPVVITGSIAISWDRAVVESQIRALLLDNYGDGAINVSEGMSNPIKKASINRLLREKVDALRDDKAEFDVQLTFPAGVLPEHFLHFTPSQMTVTLTSDDYGSKLWNH